MLRLDTFADLTCPWCFVAEARLDAVLEEAGLDEADLERYWQPFLLDPALPEVGEPWADFVARTFGSHDRAAAMFDAVADAGREVGIAFRLAGMRRAPSTRRAHRLVLAAGERGHALALRFFRAHFEDGLDLSDTDTLVRLAAEHGVDAAAVLATDAFDADVDTARRAAAALGLTGVPVVVFNRTLAVSGAQPAHVFRQALAKATAGQAPNAGG